MQSVDFVQQYILWSLLLFGHTSISLSMLLFGHTSISLSSCVIIYEYEIRTLITLLRRVHFKALYELSRFPFLSAANVGHLYLLQQTGLSQNDGA